MTETSQRPRTTEPYDRHDGSPWFVRSLSGGPSLRLYRCTVCKGLVAWTKSKAGKNYLCDVDSFLHDNGETSHKAHPWRPHFKSCERQAEYRERLVREEEYHLARATLNADHAERIRAQVAAEVAGTVTREESDALIAQLDTESDALRARYGIDR